MTRIAQGADLGRKDCKAATQMYFRRLHVTRAD
jgi:hypothetical protein